MLFGKKQILALAAGALLTIGTVVPTLATPGPNNTSGGTVTLSGTNVSTLVFTIDGGTSSSVSFPATMAPNGGNIGGNTDGCYQQGGNAVHFIIRSNTAITTGVTQQDDGAFKPTSARTFWANGTGTTVTATCSSNTIASGWNQSAAPSNGVADFYNSYAVQVQWGDATGALDTTLTYSVSN